VLAVDHDWSWPDDVEKLSRAVKELAGKPKQRGQATLPDLRGNFRIEYQLGLNGFQASLNHGSRKSQGQEGGLAPALLRKTFPGSN
jgi:hypothetical protein